MPPAPTELTSVAWTGSGDPGYLLRPSPDAEPFHEALAAGRLLLRVCDACGRARYPHGPVCPYCGSDAWAWHEVPAGASLLSWGRCHLPLVPEFPPPYLVAAGLLDAGPPLIGALLEPADAEPAPGARLRVVAQRWPSGVCVAAFVCDPDRGGAPATDGPDDGVITSSTGGRA